MTEPRTRLTFASSNTLVDYEYRFSATQNNGQITQRKDWISGEEISYQYDSLNRLISAATTGPQWGQSFTYDGFGNLLAQTVTKGSAPTLSVNVNPATNRITTGGYGYDANGNLTSMPMLSMTYDAENRLTQATDSSNGTETYNYDTNNQRVWKRQESSGLAEHYFYGIDGSLLGTYGGFSDNTDYNVYFAGRLIWAEASQWLPARPLVEDRLGSTVTHFPYGEEASATGQDRVKFATYYRDSTTALDYAQNRYYARTIARFTSPDPSRMNEMPGNPQSWNRYAYANCDPVNLNDPSGLGLLSWLEGGISWLGHAIESAFEFYVDSWRGGNTPTVTSRISFDPPIVPDSKGEEGGGGTDAAAADFGKGLTEVQPLTLVKSSPSLVNPLGADYVNYTASYTTQFGLGLGTSYIQDKFGTNYLSGGLVIGTPGPSFSAVNGFLNGPSSQQDLLNHLSGVGVTTASGAGGVVGVNYAPNSGDSPNLSGQAGFGVRQTGATFGYTFPEQPKDRWPCVSVYGACMWDPNP